MNNNIKAGADIHAGDGGYGIGTKEKYDEFVRKRNMSKNKTNTGLTIPFEVADGIVLASMIEQHGYLKQELKDHLEKGQYMHPEDFYNSTHDIIPALEILIKYYGGSIDETD
jgi:hypothetical protein